MHSGKRYESFLWLVPFCAFYLYVQLAGYPILQTLVVAFIIFALLGTVGLLPFRALYVCALVLLATCPLWRICDNYALLARNISVLRLASVIHMGDPNAMALNAASASFAIFCAGVFAEMLRRIVLGRA